jgi:hypothetical protein
MFSLPYLSKIYRYFSMAAYSAYPQAPYSRGVNTVVGT